MSKVMMRCPECGCEGASRVCDSRQASGGTTGIRRRRICLECNRRYSTIEITKFDHDRRESEMEEFRSAVRDAALAISRAR